MDYEGILEKANKLLGTGDIKEIEEFLVELMYAYDKLDLEASRAEEAVSKKRDELYLKWKEDKRKGTLNASDKDIEVMARDGARTIYGDIAVNRTIVWHYAKYIDLLTSKKITLMADDKRKKEAFNY